MSAPILYCGDTDLGTAASYLAGLMTHWGWTFDYVPSDQPLSHDDLNGRRLFIFSDYPAAQASHDLQRQVVASVVEGAGLLMIGGWESFHGQGGDWQQTPIGEALGVEISAADDRCNSSAPALLVPVPHAVEHPILSGLPWYDSPPCIGGWNVVAQGNAETLLTVCQFGDARLTPDESLVGHLTRRSPALCVKTAAQGRCAAFLSDVAPHWVGGFVDWGTTRVSAQAAGAPAIEVGNWYAQFWKQLLSWTGQLH